MKLWLIAFLIAFSQASWAEYRVYRLGVKYTPEQKKELEVLTTLDNLQYVTYFKITPQQETRLIEHWMCRGRTDGYKKYCSKPITQNAPLPPGPAQGPSSPVQRAPAQQ